MRHIVLFYRQGSDAPFWKIRTPAVSMEQIDTEVLMGAAQPRCERGMLVVVDGELGGVVESVARLGGSSRFRITLRREIDQDETDLLAALGKLARFLGVDIDEGDVDGEPDAGEGDVDGEPIAGDDGVDGEPIAGDDAVDGEPVGDDGVQDDADAQTKNGTEAPLADEGAE